MDSLNLHVFGQHLTRHGSSSYIIHQSLLQKKIRATENDMMQRRFISRYTIPSDELNRSQRGASLILHVSRSLRLAASQPAPSRMIHHMIRAHGMVRHDDWIYDQSDRIKPFKCYVP